MNTIEFTNQLGRLHTYEPIHLESGIYDGHGAVIHADGGLFIDSEGVTLKNLTVIGHVSITGHDAIIQKCKIKSEGCAIRSSADGLILRDNDIDCAGNAIEIHGGKNILAARNNTHGNITVSDAYNCVVLLNELNKLSAFGCTSLYVVKNNLHGRIMLSCNTHLLCDGNTASAISSSDNESVNGDNLTDVSYRAPHGAAEELLPHTNKDLFIGMERQTLVRDGATDNALSFNEFIRHTAERSHEVIIPPGAYSVKVPLELSKEHSDTDVYAYGVCQELEEYGPAINLSDVSNLEIHGLTTAYKRQTCGQVYVLEAKDERTLTVIPYAGSVHGFGRSKPDQFSAGFTNVFHAGKPYPWGDFGGAYTIDDNGDGTFTVTMTDRSSKIGKVGKGDILACRIAGDNRHGIMIRACHGILFKDTVHYGYAASLAVVASNGSEDVLFYRWHDCAPAAPLIDKETYEMHRSLEEKYGVCLEVYVDGEGRYRGGKPRVCNADATHITGAKTGVSVTSSILEDLCDDGTNQRSSSARLAGARDNGDGTATLTYKGCVTEIYFNMNPEKKEGNRGSSCAPFTKGDRVLVYASNGKTVCNTKTLSESIAVGEISFSVTGPWNTKSYISPLYEITVPASDVDFSALDGYDLSDNHYQMTHKVFVDNLSRNSASYIFDNVLIRNSRARGILIKTRDAKIVNCTFRDLLHTGVLLSAEPSWGESSVAQEALIERCLFDHTGYTNNEYTIRHTPITVLGVGNEADENRLLYRDITVNNNKFINNTHNYFVAIHAARDVKITNNIFCRDESEEKSHPELFLDLDTAVNIEISGNKYPTAAPVWDGISAKKCKNIFGDDIEKKDVIE